MIQHYTAIYRPIDNGYMGQLAEWPELITEGADLADVRAMLEDALTEMVAAYKELGKEIPPGEKFLRIV